MRTDMDKVITERPRYGGGYKTPKGERRRLQRCAAEDQPKRERIRRKWFEADSEKEFSDRIGPLRRWVLSKVGKNWDKVFSEIRDVLPSSGGQVIQHVYTHLWEYVTPEVRLINGQPCNKNGNSRIYSLTYVDPVTRVLRLNKEYRRYRFKYEKPLGPGVIVNKFCRYMQDAEGIWWKVEFRSYPKDEWIPIQRYTSKGLRPSFECIHNCAYDVWLGYTFSSSHQAANYYKASIYAVSKRQLNKREIKRLGLRKAESVLPNLVRKS